MGTTNDEAWMDHALELASQGRGFVEPNPMVGCVLVSRDGLQIGSGFHERYGELHAERNAIADAIAKGNQSELSGSTAYVTLEPCCHTGKTPPCTDALLEASVARVVFGMQDPFPKVAGGGMKLLRDAGVEVEIGVRESECRTLNQPYLKRVNEGQPWVIAKWAMTLDGKIATRSGSSQWISGEASREQVQELRGRVDAVMVGTGTTKADDPMLNCRVERYLRRTAKRVVVSSDLDIDPEGQLVQTAREIPLIVSVDDQQLLDSSVLERQNELEKLGVEVVPTNGSNRGEHIVALLNYLGKAGATNILVEGGSGLLGTLNDIGQIDQCEVYIAPKIAGGIDAPSPIGGQGFDPMNASSQFRLIGTEQVESDVHLSLIHQRHVG